MMNSISLKQKIENIKEELAALQQQIHACKGKTKQQKKEKCELQEKGRILQQRQSELGHIKNKILSSPLVCTLCSSLVQRKDRRKHLRKCHQMYDVDDLKKYFVTKKAYKAIQYPKLYYNPDAKPSNCGKVIKGAPPPKIIYTPVETNRRKH